MNLRFLSIIVALLMGIGHAAAITAESAFLSAPKSVLPLIDFVKRSEMVQLYNAGMASKAAPNLYGGPAELLSVEPDALTLTYGHGATLTVALLPTAAGDTAVMMLENLATPAIDANVRVYTRDWTLLSTAYQEPAVADWALKKHRAEAVEQIPFMLAQGCWDSASRTITLTPTVEQWLDENKRDLPAKLLRKELVLKWNGKKFTLQR